LVVFSGVFMGVETITFGRVTFFTIFGFCIDVTILVLPVEVIPVAVLPVREDGESAGEDPPPEVLDGAAGAIYDPPQPPLGPPDDGCGLTITVREMIELIFPAISAFRYWRMYVHRTLVFTEPL